MPLIPDLNALHDEIRRRIGEVSTTNTSITDAEITRQINLYLQRLPMRASFLLEPKQPERPIRFDMWRTIINSTTSAAATNMVVVQGSQTVLFPTNYDHWVSFVNIKEPATALVDDDEKIDVVENVSRDHHHVRRKTQGPARYIEILGKVSSGSAWRTQAKIWPKMLSTVTPNFEMTYWRLPADLSSGTDLPDIDYKYYMLCIWGPILEILRDDHPAYDRYVAQEVDMIQQLASTGRSV